MAMHVFYFSTVVVSSLAGLHSRSFILLIPTKNFQTVHSDIILKTFVFLIILRGGFDSLCFPILMRFSIIIVNYSTCLAQPVLVIMCSVFLSVRV